MRRAILVFGLCLAVAPTASSESAVSPEGPRLLMIALDAVPYGVVERVTDPALGDQAIFRDFHRPVPLISTFPSTTSLALGGILEPFDLERSPGYEHRYFDRQQNRKLGGGLFSYHHLRFPWREFFHWQPRGVFKKGIKIFHLQKSGRQDIDESLAAFAASDEPVFHLYHDLTDLMGHVKGPDSLEHFLRHLDAALRALAERGDAGPFTVTIYSDHGLSGGDPLRNVRRGVKKALRDEGYRISGHLRRPRDVVFVPYGLVSSLVAFTAEGEEVNVARILADVEGVNLCATIDGDGWRLITEDGDARLLRRSDEDGDSFSYQPLTGDPLGYAALIDENPDSEEPTWHSDAWWLEATSDAIYPDALFRTVQGFELVANPASVICGTAEGYMYGAAYTVLGSRISTGRLRWTHGSMHREASLGFVMTDAPGWRAPAIVRFDHALTAWGAPAGVSRGVAPDN
ncbi:MAG: alkaline phosphatase family protein [bacterium]|nr:alkaline phosphatase family protein [bacterium]